MKLRVLWVAVLAAATAAVGAAAANGATKPSASEEKAIEKAFRAEVGNQASIRKIRVSTEDDRFAAVFYDLAVEPPAGRAGRGAPSEFSPPPALLKKAKGKWKTVPKAPKKVMSDLKVKERKSHVEISGDFTALLTRAARCSESGDFYTASIYEPDIDLYLSVQIPQYVGRGWYPARAVGSVAGLYSNSGTVLQYETGLAHDATAPSGDILVQSGWGFIGAGMARTPPDETTMSNTVTVRGTWECG